MSKINAKSVWEKIKYWGQLLMVPFYWLGNLIPRDEDIWLFGSTFGNRFSDNPRYLYLYVSQNSEKQTKKLNHLLRKKGYQKKDVNCKNIKAVWISKDKEIVKLLKNNGYYSEYLYSLQGIRYCLTGRYYFFDNYSKDISFWLSCGAEKINLWHGVGNKRINYDNKHDYIRNPRDVKEALHAIPRKISDEKPSHYVLATSPKMAKIFSRAFRIPMDHVIQAGYPRNDYLMSNECLLNVLSKEEKSICSKIKEFSDAGNRILCYVPTFRDSEKMLKDIMAWETLNRFLVENQMLLVCKLHPKSKIQEDFNQIAYSNIVVADQKADINVILKKADLLITDYSSAYTDYTLLDRPVVAFQYDYETYCSETRDAYFDFDKYMPEVRAKDQESLERAILEVLREDKALKWRRKSSELLIESREANGCKNIVEYVTKLNRE